MKLTPENKKALEDAIRSVTINDMGDYTRINVKKPQVSTKDPVVLLQAATLLLEILWEPLAEMLEARGKLPFSEESNGRLLFEIEEADSEFYDTAANKLAAIRKAVGVLTSKELLLEAAKASYEDNNAALKAEVERLRGVEKHARRVMDLLDEHGASIVPHLMDTDDNAGQFLREALKGETDGK